MQDFYAEEFHNAGIDVLGIAISAPESDVRDFVDSAGLTFPMSHDLYGELATAYGVTGVPNYFFLDQEGRVAETIRGAPGDVEIIRSLLRDLHDE